jgi:molybdate transport system ATP-binding protein
MSQGDGLSAHFTGRLHDFRLDAAFTLPPRGITALTGPSGSGKTTVLRCIAGLTRLGGRLAVDGEVWQDDRTFLAPHLRSVGVVFQEPSLLAHLSVKDNLLYGRRRAKPAEPIKVDDVVSLLGMSALMGRSTGKLSGGERQRVAIGRALLTQPRLLLMDEPVSSLDRDSKAEVLGYLERLHRALEIPVLYVSHDPAEISRLADRVLVMRDGAVSPATTDGRAVAQARLAALDPDTVERLALAALLAGLEGG